MQVRIIVKSTRKSYTTPWYEEGSWCSMERFIEIIRQEPENLTVIIERRESDQVEQSTG